MYRLFKNTFFDNASSQGLQSLLDLLSSFCGVLIVFCGSSSKSKTAYFVTLLHHTVSRLSRIYQFMVNKLKKNCFPPSLYSFDLKIELGAPLLGNA